MRTVVHAAPRLTGTFMHHAVEHEDLLIAFASSAGLKPEQVAAAAQALGVVWDDGHVRHLSERQAQARAAPQRKAQAFHRTVPSE